MISHVEHFLREIGSGVRRSIGSHLAPVVLIAVALFILGLFLAGTRNINEVIRYAQAKVGVTVYLAADATDAEKKELNDWLPKLGGVRAVTFRSEEEALEKFKE